MLFHTNFENPNISKKHEKAKEIENLTNQRNKARSKLKFTVRSILPNKVNLHKSQALKEQEEEVRLFEQEQEEARQYEIELQRHLQKESKQEKRRLKRRLYKQRRNKKIKEIKEMKPSEGEIQLVEIVNSVHN